MIPILRRLGLVPAPEPVLSAERINRSVLDERAREYAGDVEYRRRVMDRMRDGYRCTHPPLIEGAAHRQRRAVARVTPFNGEGEGAVTERPIIFGAESVRAILAGTKTQTRRLLKLRSFDRVGAIVPSDGALNLWDAHDTTEPEFPRRMVWHSIACPYGVPGDRLWVRETWRVSDSIMVTAPHTPGSVHFRADRDECSGGPWHSSIHMPRWASRITLELTDVRVQRVQEISQEDAKAEGVLPPTWERDGLCFGRDHQHLDARNAFACLWNQINGKRAPWESKPWVWCLSFRRVQP